MKSGGGGGEENDLNLGAVAGAGLVLLPHFSATTTPPPRTSLPPRRNLRARGSCRPASRRFTGRSGLCGSERSCESGGGDGEHGRLRLVEMLELFGLATSSLGKRKKTGH